ncbi:hypothetical protein AB3S75_039666 [Citrus x aurantiifolia]
MSSLPLDLISDILSRLPVKPLLRFRCVSKCFCSLIDSQDFVKLHLNQAIETNSGLSLIVPTLTSDNKFFSLELDSVDNPVEIEYPFKKYNRGHTSVIGCCHGLLAMFNRRLGMSVFNPTTKKFKLFPQFWSDCYTDYMTNNFHFDGFGYDASTDDYKLVRIIQSYKVDYLEVIIYSLKADTWRRTREFPYYILDDRCNGVFIAGALHWLAARGSVRTGQNMILAFDLKSEKFYEVQQPHGMKGGFCSQVGVLRGCLWINSYYHDEPRCDIWVMKEYGSQQSWSKLCSFSKMLHETCYYTEAFAFSKDGDKALIYQHSRCLHWYNLKDHKQDVIEIRNENQSLWDAFICMGSLASIDAYTTVGVDTV